MTRPGRIIDSDEDEFTSGQDRWATAKNDLATELQNLVMTLSGQDVSQIGMGIGVPTRTQNYILGSCRKWMAEDEYKSKRPKFNN